MNRSPFKTVLREAMLMLLAACFALGSALAALPMHPHSTTSAADAGLFGLADADTLCVASGVVHVADSAARGDASGEADQGAAGGEHRDACLHCLCAPAGTVVFAAPQALHAIGFVRLSVLRVGNSDAPALFIRGLPSARGPPLTI